LADNVTLNASSGTFIAATDQVGTDHFQRVKLVDGTLDSSAAIPGDATDGLVVNPKRPNRGTLTTGTITANGQSVTASVADQAGAGVVVFGTYSASLTFECSIDNGTTYVAIQGQQIDNAVVTSAPGALVNTARAWEFGTAGMTHIRVRATAFTSGTVSVAWVATGIAADPVVSAIPAPAAKRIQVQSAGLTTATTAYTSGDQLGTILTFANAVRQTGATGVIQSATLLDQSQVIGAVDLFLFTQSVTLAADNAAASFSDADMLNCVGIISFPAPTAVAAVNSISTVVSGLGITCAATSLFGALVTRSANAVFAGGATSLAVSLHILQD
jgi:hypothetical protein